MRPRILNDELELSDYQKEVLAGLLLGDGCLERSKNSPGARLKVGQSLKQKEFVVWLYDIFRNFVQTPPRIKYSKRNGKSHEEVVFNTLTHSCFKAFYEMFYQNGNKVIPESINQILTATAVAVWFMSDGSVKSKESRGRILNTQSFTKSDIERLRIILKSKFGLQTSIRMQKDGLQIYISGKSAELLDALLRDKLLPYFYYKLPYGSKNFPEKLTILPKT